VGFSPCYLFISIFRRVICYDTLHVLKKKTMIYPVDRGSIPLKAKFLVQPQKPTMLSIKSKLQGSGIYESILNH